MVSQPDAARFAAALRRAELVVVQDAYHPTETGALAHVLLPAAQWGEKEGTQTNSERRVSLMRRAVEPPGSALPDWEIFARVARAMGFQEQFGWSSAAEVHAEYVRATAGRLCDQTGLSHERLRREGALQWPVPARGLAGRTTTAPSGSTPRSASRSPTAVPAWPRRRTPSRPTRRTTSTPSS